MNNLLITVLVACFTLFAVQFLVYRFTSIRLKLSNSLTDTSGYPTEVMATFMNINRFTRSLFIDHFKKVYVVAIHNRIEPKVGINGTYGHEYFMYLLWHSLLLEKEYARLAKVIKEKDRQDIFSQYINRYAEDDIPYIIKNIENRNKQCCVINLMDNYREIRDILDMTEKHIFANKYTRVTRLLTRSLEDRIKLFVEESMVLHLFPVDIYHQLLADERIDPKMRDLLYEYIQNKRKAA